MLQYILTFPLSIREKSTIYRNNFMSCFEERHDGTKTSEISLVYLIMLSEKGIKK